jgi:type IV secretion system protein VirD4
MLSGNSINIRDIGKKKSAVYIIVPDEKTTYHFLVTTFIKQVYELLISEAQATASKTLPVRVNFVLDEFCNIPKIPDMPSMISAARSRNMRFFLVAQSLHQLTARYKEDAATIKGNCDNWVFLTSKEIALLEEISSLCGSVSQAGEQNHRPLISISELQRLDKQKGEALIMHARQYPIITEIADIDSYPDFKCYPEVLMKPFDLPPDTLFSVKQLYRDIKAEKVGIPFIDEGDVGDPDRDDDFDDDFF